MSIDFFGYTEKVNPVEKFGLIDPEDSQGKKSAYIDYDFENVENWNANVQCNNRSDYSFIAVDNNIPLTKKVNGKNETASSCDAMLYTKNTVCFIELKADKKGNDWCKKAVKQLESTIELFGKNLDRFNSKKAYICNSRSPHFHFSHKNIMQEFYKQNKIVLRIQTEIAEFI